jgi:hypothetical protein
MAIKKGTGHQPLRLPGLTALSAAFMAAGLAGCSGSGTTTYYPNCVDQYGRVVSDAYCQNNPNGLFWYWMATQRYGSGYYVPVSARTGASWFRTNDPTARVNAGLPRTGSVGSSKVTSSSGGFDGSHAGTSGSGEGGHGSGGGHGSAGAGGHGSAGG